MKWNGVNRKTTPTDDDHSVSHFQENTRLKIQGELRRRNGLSRANIAKIATPIYGIASTVAPVPSIVLQGSTGAIDGYNTFGPLWGDVQLLAPTGTAVFNAGYIYTTADGRSTGSINIQTGTVYNNGAHIGYITGSLPQGTWNTSLQINSGGVNGNFYRVTFTCDITGTISFGTDSVRYISRFDVTDPTAYGWILDSYSSNLVLDTVPVDSASLIFAKTTYGPQGPHAQITMVYITKGGGQVGLGIPFTAHDMESFDGFGAFSLSGTYSITVELQTPDPSGSSWTITVNRSEAFDTSYDIYGKDGSYPADPSDGEYLGSLTINPGSASTSGSVTPSTSSSTWKFIAVPRYGSMQGPMGRLT